MFQMGRCEMQLQDYAKASASFTRTQDLLKSQLQTLSLAATANGQAIGTETTASEQSLAELVKPSIFDTEEMKRVKGLMLEVQEYMEEIEFLRKNRAELDLERANAQKAAQEKGSDVPEGFGKPQPNADQFQTATFTLKPKKRTHQ